MTLSQHISHVCTLSEVLFARRNMTPVVSFVWLDLMILSPTVSPVLLILNSKRLYTFWVLHNAFGYPSVSPFLNIYEFALTI